MNRHVNAIAGRLSLRSPQRRSLEILDRITEIVPPKKGADLTAALGAIRAEFPTVSDFEREFPSLCFALATGVGKTRLMGAFVSYLHLAHGLNNFFVLAPNLTIYKKLIADFTPNTAKYVFTGISEFAVSPPVLTTGENYERQLASGGQLFPTTINIFNISKINSEVRGGRNPRIRSFREEIGESYFDYLASLDDLVLIMDESHRYRASAGIRAINELRPVLGLELTATPFVEAGNRAPLPFKNVIFDYPLGRAMEDGFVKEPAVVTRKNFNPAGMAPEKLEQLKLEDGVRLHENLKVELETYARETGNRIVKPFVLVIARDTTHAGELMALIKSDAFFEGRYAPKVIQVDSSRTGAEEDEMVERLLKVEHTDEPTEIVIHVNMLKEGWDVTNLYTIVPLRAANARTLIEQSIGRGLRLPYGKRTGIAAVDTLNIVAHDRFQEIVDEARRPDSTIRLRQIVLAPEELQNKSVSVVSQTNLTAKLGFAAGGGSRPGMPVTADSERSEFKSPEEARIAQIAYGVIRKLESEPGRVPSVTYLEKKDVREQVLREVAAEYKPAQLELDGVAKAPDIGAVVARTIEIVQQQTIDIPRILIVPKGEVVSGFKAFTLDLKALNYQAPEDELWLQFLRTGQSIVIGLGVEGITESRLEDYVVSGLVDFDDVAYDSHAELLYNLAGQVVTHLKKHLKDDEARKVLRLYQREIARFVHAQMQKHYWESDVEYEVKISRGFTELKESAYTATAGEAALDFRASPADKSNMARYVFTGFQRCLYDKQKFQSEAERLLAVILDRDALKWFRPAKGQFQIFYKSGADHLEYQPDFVAETKDKALMLEVKRSDQLTDEAVVAKRDVAVQWCKNASDHAKSYGGKQWQYALIPHNAIAANMTLQALSRQFVQA